MPCTHAFTRRLPLQISLTNLLKPVYLLSQVVGAPLTPKLDTPKLVLRAHDISTPLTLQCVVLMGRPMFDAMTTVKADASSILKPLLMQKMLVNNLGFSENLTLAKVISSKLVLLYSMTKPDHLL